MHFTVHPAAAAALHAALLEKINNKTKPIGALGRLEALALQIGLVQQTTTPVLREPHMVVFAADHGITAEGVSSYPADVTRQMVLNFARGGAAINVFCRQNGLALRVVDAGVLGGPLELPTVLDQRLGEGTANFVRQPAMSAAQCQAGMAKGAALVQSINAETGCNIIGFGEMGIGNTSSAAMLMHLYTGIAPGDCIGRGTGLNDAQLAHKQQVLAAALACYELQTASSRDPLTILAWFGGFEIVQMCGAMLAAAEQRMVILVDGFIASAALLAAHALQPVVLDYCVFCHQSDEAGHRRMLDWWGVRALLQLDLRLGEGTGAALALPLVQAAVHFLQEMASFSEAGVSGQET